MNLVLSIIIVFLVFFIISFIILCAMHLMKFTTVHCKHCNHPMEFKGEKERFEGNVYLFQCPECKSWREIPVSEFNKMDSYPMNHNLEL